MTVNNWHKYKNDLGRTSKLLCEGREYLGQNIFVTSKRCGENVSLRISEGEVLISSHGQDPAGSDIQAKMKRVPEWQLMNTAFKDTQYNDTENRVFYGELMMNVCPTRIERNKKHLHWILFEIGRAHV